jgi:hypothetical protein
MANILPTQLVGQLALTNIQSAIYTVPANTSTKVSRASFCNSAVVPLQLSVAITQAGGTTVGTVIDNVTISPGQTYVSPELSGAVLAAGWNITAVASVTNFIWANISGVTIQ